MTSGSRRLPFNTRMGTGALAISLWACAAIPLAGQQISGTVLDAHDGGPMADATVAVFDVRDSLIVRLHTDSTGRFSSMLPRAGTYSLRVEKIGYRTQQTDTFAIEASEVLAVRIVVGVDAVPLAPIEVLARYHVPRAHPDYHRRVEWGRRTGFGHFITRDDIEATALLRASSILMQVPSIRLVYARDGTVYLGASARGTYNCRPAVFLNGMEISQSFGLDALSLDELEGIEIYRSPTEIPSELARPGVCAVVAFWTRVGQRDGRWSWRPVLAAGAVALTGILLFGFIR
jgi:5-hydroxyisourate hydrolase-like protein (transthyretin family)